MFYGLIALSLGFSYISAKSNFYPLKWVAGFLWLGVLVYWIDADLLVDGTPPDVILMLVFVMLGLLFLLWGMAGRLGKGNVSVETEVDSTGKTIRRIMRQGNPSRNTHQSTMNERALEHKLAIRKALGSGKRRRR